MIRSIRDRILVRIIEIEKPKGLLIMPSEKKEFQIGHVMAVGGDIDGWEGMGQEIHIGDYVYTRKFAGLLIEYKGEEYVSLDIKEILAVSSELG